MENLVTHEHSLHELREIRRLLEEHFRKDKPQEVGFPNIVDISFVIRQLNICRSTYYKHVKDKLLHPVVRVGNRDYFDRRDVEDLRRQHTETKLPLRKLTAIEQAPPQTKRAA